MDAYEELFLRAARDAARYRASVADRPVSSGADMAALRSAFGGPLPDAPTPPGEVVDRLVAAAEPGLTGTVGPRFFGFVIGGSLPAAAAADMLATGWDQCAYNAVLSPAAAAAEEVAGTWAKELLGLPGTASVGFVTGAQAANTVGLAAGRHQVLAEAGWDVERHGLHGAPRVRIVASGERHATIDRSLRLLGFGTAAVETVGTDANGAIDVEDLASVLAAGPSAPTLVCLQAGNVNTGACDDFPAAIEIARRHRAWIHVDGAFGLWAGANPATAHLVRGVEAADSWGCDAHKWLNVPYDSGLVFCAKPDVHAAAVSYSAAYLVGSGGSANWGLGDLTPESSRRARGFAVWAALQQLGRSGVAELVERGCHLARRMAEQLAVGGATIENDVVLNQVLVGFGDDTPLTDRLIEAVQSDGTCWLGGTLWHGKHLMRISFSNWTTTEDDVDRSAEAILRLARERL
ncbi:glutamate/tyrosine decarboxylase-like PLP-dependent enzyme [Streptacidiphilus sp. MAP12-20]|uniref:pyridoxal phosphate-dependent decarboxylase family protein n=1 Tax=Streptacidiphilus sp. MAP12-20 TaxID=3156299 RepID=UPI003518B1FF